MPDNVYLSFGSNVGNKRQNIERAYIELESAGVKLLKISSFYQTKPYGVVDQPDFLNSVARVSTCLGPFKLLETLKNIEKKIGRVKTFRWGPRTIDIDILFYGDLILRSKNLNIPHIDLCNRCFVLIPLCEVDCDFIHPEKKLSVRRLLNNLRCNTQSVKKI